MELNKLKIAAIGSRVVHGGNIFYKPLRIDQSNLKELNKLKDLAPLHNEVDVSILETCLKLFPEIPIIAIFDTAFHHDLPQIAATYALPKEVSEKHKVRRYGFHGIAHQYILETISKKTGLKILGSKIISCHLGNGASVCAIKDGKSIDTSMGFTPNEGLIMGTRSGDLDPGLLLYLIQSCGYKPSEIDSIINRKSGLLGLSKLSSDLRELEFAKSTNKDANFAIEAFIYRIAKYIGSYFVALGGADIITFSGGIGENSNFIRGKVCEKISCLGIQIEDKLNLQLGSLFKISTESSPTAVWVVHADESLKIAKLTYETAMATQVS